MRRDSYFISVYSDNKSIIIYQNHLFKDYLGS